MSSNPTGTIGGVPFEEHNQRTDPLGEALEWWDDNKGFLWQMIPNEEWAHIERGMAAARNWHTRSDPDYLAAAKKLSWWLSEAEWEDIDDEMAGEWIVQARSIVDAALTDTAEGEI